MSLAQAARRAANLMKERRRRVVTAESCTGGLVAASLAGFAGISEWLCGGLVVYRNSAKAAFLGISDDLLQDPGPVSAAVCERMAIEALERTPEADLAVSVTGHLGPDAPAGLDGVVFCGAAWRTTRTPYVTGQAGRRRSKAPPASEPFVCRTVLPAASRTSRQRLAAEAALETLSDVLALPLDDEWPADVEWTARDWRQLALGDVDAVCIGGADIAEDQLPERKVVFPGAFHPLHQGHLQVAAWAKELLSAEVEFEISIANVDKPLIDFGQAIARVRQFQHKQTVWLTRAPTFLEKSAIFPEATFVVGADTIARIGDARYYANSEAFHQAIAAIADRGCRFLVFGRALSGKFMTLRDLALPPPLRRLCRQAPEEWRIDVASRELRRARQSRR